MPLQGEARREATARWRRNRTAGYMRWLYRKRKLRIELAAFFRAEIEDALAAPDTFATMVTLRRALEEADRREREVGNRYDHERDAPYWEER